MADIDDEEKVLTPELVDDDEEFEEKPSFFKRNRIQFVLFVLFILFFAAYFSPRIFIVVNSGEAAVKWLRFGGGTVTNRPPYREGLHVIFPWDRMFVYNVRVQEEPYVAQVLTRNALPIKLDLSIRYHPQLPMLPLLHQRVGPDYVKKVVVPEVENVIRAAVGEWEADQLYANRNALHDVINEAIEQIGQLYIQVDDVLIKRITFPPVIADAIEAKLKEQQVAQAFKYKIQQAELEAQRKEIEANGFAKYNEIIAASLKDDILIWKGIDATREIAQSPNAKVVLIGNSAGEMPIILGENFAGKSPIIEAGKQSAIQGVQGAAQAAAPANGQAVPVQGQGTAPAQGQTPDGQAAPAQGQTPANGQQTPDKSQQQGQ